ncbi:MAG: hypothetical protein M1294_01345 [Firmicutes bacterium]|nr:hypothetical protein [Bacillota bacterium]
MERHEAIPVIVAKFFQESRDVNPYASAVTMRAFDQVIRNQLADSLARSAGQWRALYQQQGHLVGTPSRDHPFPDKEAMDSLRRLKQLADNVSQTVAHIHALEAPSSDRVYHRIRNNDQILEMLIDVDYQLATTAAAIDDLTNRLTLEGWKEIEPAFQERLAQLIQGIRNRSRIVSEVV